MDSNREGVGEREFPVSEVYETEGFVSAAKRAVRFHVSQPTRDRLSRTRRVDIYQRSILKRHTC